MNRTSAKTSVAVTEHPQRLHTRLIATFMVLLVGAMVIAAVVLLGLRVNEMRARLVDNTVIKAHTIATQIAPSLEFDEPSAAETILAQFSNDSNVRAITIENRNGDVFADLGDLQLPVTFNPEARSTEDSDWLWVSVPVIVDNTRSGTIYLRASLGDLQREVRRSLFTTIPVSAVVALLTILLMLKALRIITLPITSLAETAAKITENGDYGQRAKRFANDEIGLLTDEFNLMLETIESQSRELADQHTQLARSERLESLGLLAGGVAHDLNNILGPLVALPELILMDLDKDHVARDDIMMMGTASRRAAVVIQDLLSLARRGSYKLEAVDLNAIVRECIATPAVQLRLDNLGAGSCQLLLDETLHSAAGSEPHLTQLVLNLTINAIEAMMQHNSQGTLILSTENIVLNESLAAYETIPPGAYTMFSAKDQGPGLTEQELKHLFEPFFTTKEMGASGSGLGLSVVYGVVHDHEGFLDVKSEPGRGAEFRVYLKRSTNAISKSDESLDLEFRLNARILVVDDQASQRTLSEQLLNSLGYRTHSAISGREAVALLREDADFDLMIVDMIMQDGFDGLDTIREVLGLWPDLPCIIATGYSRTDRVKSALELGARACLNKPYTLKTLAKVVREALEKAG
jgi:signal transduction histidine kinase/ActR/RegA family two-component response regulator